MIVANRKSNPLFLRSMVPSLLPKLVADAVVVDLLVPTGSSPVTGPVVVFIISKPPEDDAVLDPSSFASSEEERK